jgi:hypothetical protein
LRAEESSADVTKGGTTAPSTAPLQGREQMRSAAQGKQAGCGLAKKEASKGLLFWIDHALPVDDYLAVHVRIMIPTAMPSAIAIVVTMDNHCSAFAVNRRCRTSYRRSDVAAERVTVAKANLHVTDFGRGARSAGDHSAAGRGCFLCTCFFSWWLS